MSAKLKVFASSGVIALLLDQLTKLWILRNIHYSDEIRVIDGFFHLTHVRNPGAAFSMFATAPEGTRMFLFVGISLLAIGIIFSFYQRLAPGDRFAALSLGLILGGALGNLFDRVFRGGEVVDFLHFKLWSGYSWPDFNLADSFIVVGVGFLVLELLVHEGESRVNDAAEPDPSTDTSSNQ